MSQRFQLKTHTDNYTTVFWLYQANIVIKLRLENFTCELDLVAEILLDLLANNSTVLLHQNDKSYTDHIKWTAML